MHCQFDRWLPANNCLEPSRFGVAIARGNAVVALTIPSNVRQNSRSNHSPLTRIGSKWRPNFLRFKPHADQDFSRKTTIKRGLLLFTFNCRLSTEESQFLCNVKPLIVPSWQSLPSGASQTTFKSESADWTQQNPRSVLPPSLSKSLTLRRIERCGVLRLCEV